MNLKFNLSMVNTILMIVVLILVIVACVKKSRENFQDTTCFIPCKEANVASDEGLWGEGTTGFKCGGPECADVNSYGAGEDERTRNFTGLDEMDNLKKWAQSDDDIHESWVYGEVRIKMQLTQIAQYLFKNLEKILEELDREGDSAANAIEKVKNASKQFVEEDDDGKKDYRKPNLQKLKLYIKSSGNYDDKAERLILKLKKSHHAVKNLIKLEEKTDGEIDNDKRDIKQKNWDDLQGGISEIYKIMHNGKPIDFLDQFSKLINEEQLLIDFVKDLIKNLGTKHKNIALETIGIVPTTQATQA